MRRVILLAAIPLSAIAGCGGDESNGVAPVRDGELSGLIERLPPVEDHDMVVAVDIDEAIPLLGATDDLEPARGMSAPRLADRRLANLAIEAMPYLSMPTADQMAVTRAIDFGQIDAAAGNVIAFGHDALTVLATDQPVEEIAAVLEKEGYSREDTLLTSEDSLQSFGPSAVAGGPGLVAVGYDGEVVRNAAAGKGEPYEGIAVGLAAGLDAPAVSAIGFNSGCVDAIAVGEALKGFAGELVIATSNAEAGAFRDSDLKLPLYWSLDFGKPVAEGDRLTVPFMFSFLKKTAILSGLGPVALPSSGVGADSLYGCGWVPSPAIV